MIDADSTAGIQVCLRRATSHYKHHRRIYSPANYDGPFASAKESGYVLRVHLTRCWLGTGHGVIQQRRPGRANTYDLI